MKCEAEAGKVYKVLMADSRRQCPRNGKFFVRHPRDWALPRTVCAQHLQTHLADGWGQLSEDEYNILTVHQS